MTAPELELAPAPPAPAPIAPDAPAPAPSAPVGDAPAPLEGRALKGAVGWAIVLALVALVAFVVYRALRTRGAPQQ